MNTPMISAAVLNWPKLRQLDARAVKWPTRR